MTLKAEQMSPCSKLIYLILVAFTSLYVIRNIQSCIRGNLIGSIVAIAFLLTGIIIATYLIL
ncbi:hypothetical protein SAMN04487772_1466 [[Clostridium] polysaccharolyticum]|uniref:Uncharacterized protein n=1 Tax=[Clostridium] polysaccharolyticum TaxID=29364 RepID=A0A1I0G3B4_9FIRM|nr:hypothetical protein SAMN04487772_1466 [[Clostridium] polysaccharolyticum]